MNKSILALAVSALFVMGSAQAETNANDVSATLTVSGTVTAAQTSCTVDLDQTTIALSANLADLPAQGSNATVTDTVAMNIGGDDECADLVSSGKMAYRFLGTADSAQGTALANTAPAGEGAAAGIGIALYGSAGNVLEINKDTMAATTTPSHLGLGMVKLEGQEATAGSVQGSMTIQIERL